MRGRPERSGSKQAVAGLITHQIPLFGEERIAHVDLDVVDISVASLLPAEALLLQDILHLRRQQQQQRVEGSA